MAKKKESTAAAGSVRARVLLRFWDGLEWHEADGVVEAAPETIEAWESLGAVDSNEDAIAYAASLKA